METQNPQILDSNQLELDQAFEDYLDKSIAEGDEDIKNGNVFSYDDIRKEIKEKYFTK